MQPIRSQQEGKLGKLPLAGVVGHPIAHSLSPRLHGHWLEQLQLSGSYVPLHIEPQHFEQAFAALPRLGFSGVNVTLPYKQEVMAMVDHLSDGARAIGAVNTVTFVHDEQGGLSIHGDNTDAYGFMAHLRHATPSWSGTQGSALVLGAGGAARAVVYALRQAGVSQVYIANRTLEKAEDLAEAFGPQARAVAWGDGHELVAEVSLIVNTTSLGMAGKPALDLSLAGVQASTVVYDIVYTPLETDLLAEARKAGCCVVDGLGMLLHQGVPGFERWFGAAPTVTDATRRAVLA